METKFISSKLSFVVLLLCLTCVSSINICHGRIYDEKNRQLYLHGVNVAVKVAPYIPKTDAYDPKMSFSKEDIENLTRNGFNAIRLGIMWPGVQPQEDSYNETYLQEMVKIVNSAGEAGIYTILEFHQKVLSQSFCGIGLPAWLIQKDNRYKTFPFPIEKQKYPLEKNMTPDRLHCQRHCSSTYFYSYDCAQGFDQLYQVDSYLNKRLTKMWQKVAQCFKGNQFLIAYDLINQPWVGNQIRNPTLLIPGVAQKLKLQKFYDRLSESIRSVDDKTAIMFEPTIIDKHTGTGYSHAPGGDHYKDRSILGISYGKENYKCLGLKMIDSYRLKVPMLISQMYPGGESLDRAEAYGLSWFYWYFKDFGRNRTQLMDENKDEEKGLQMINSKEQSGQLGCCCKKIVRTYLQRVAGELSYSGYDSQTARFIASYTACPGGQTILYLNKEWVYGNKYSIEASPKDMIEIIESKEEAQLNYVIIKFNGKEKEQVVVNVVKL